MSPTTKAMVVVVALGLPFGIALGAFIGKMPVADKVVVATAAPPPARPTLQPTAAVVAPVEPTQVPPPAEQPTLQPTQPETPLTAPTPQQSVVDSSGPIVCIDPGHPSETSSGANAHGLSENLLNWQVALELKPMLEARGIRCVLTKDELNQHVTNKRRAEIANGDNEFQKPARLFIRLHCDVGSNRGYTWYYPDRSGSKGGVTGPPRKIQRESGRAAQLINEAMKPILQPHLKSNPIHTDAATFVGGKQGGVLTGSIFSRVPTALIEMCYINQKSDAQFISSVEGRTLMAQALATGIEAYLNS